MLMSTEPVFSEPVFTESSFREEILAIGEYLKSNNYDFTTISPASHRHVLARPRINSSALGHSEAPAFSELDLLREYFGWNRPLSRERLSKELPRELQKILSRHSRTYSQDGAELMKSKIRFSTARGMLFAHSGYPTDDKHSVFFGPDTYRFINFIVDHVGEPRSAVDLGSGSGAGGLVLDRVLRERGTPLSKLLMTDITEEALEFIEANAALNGISGSNGIDVTFVKSDLLKRVSPGFDLIISNPPFIIDEEKRVYRDGGGDYGTDLSVKIVRESLEYLETGGTLLLYTGAPVVAGRDRLRCRLDEILNRSDFTYSYRELDPDIFGELLGSDAYRGVERIAAVGIVLKRVAD